MKTLQFIFIFTIIRFCFSDDKCTTGYESLLKNKCQDNSCTYQPDYNEICISITNNDCSKGDGYQNSCPHIFHKDFPKLKCDYNSVEDECVPIDTSCGDFNSVVSIPDFVRDKDLCASFKAPIGQRCLLSNTLSCTSYADSCDNSSPCTSGFLLSDYKTLCVSKDGGGCESKARTCTTSGFKNVNKDICSSLKSSDTLHQVCVYSDNICKAEYLCENYPNPSNQDECESIIPLTSTTNGYEYDYKSKCVFVEAQGTNPARCRIERETRTCSEYNGNDLSICKDLKTKDSNKRCVIKGSSCVEEYKTCESYSQNELRKTRTVCEGLTMLEDNVKCVYNIEEDKCLTEKNYTSCEEYDDGISKKICESIKPTPHSRCILDKDSKCKERAFLCSEVFDSENCLYYAKPSTSNKRCAYDSSRPDVCYEEYLKCEDYIGKDSTICQKIQLFDGKKCEFDYITERCRTKNKTCSEAHSKEECNLIAESGVLNPDRKVCRYIQKPEYDDSGNFIKTVDVCMETYKYCSDFRESNRYFCENYIKPFNEEEDKIDITSKCKYEDGRCQKVPKECSEADGNPVLCSLISPKIQDHEVKYCAYIGNQCKLQFKKCEDWDPTDPISCSDIIPENYLDKPCERKLVNGEQTCAKKDVCNLFPSTSSISVLQVFSNLCHSIGHDCKLELEGCITIEEDSCQDIEFYKDDPDNEKICKDKGASDPYKNCVLKEDKSGCEEIINISYQSPFEPQIEENSSGFIAKGINLLLILLCILS